MAAPEDLLRQAAAKFFTNDSVQTFFCEMRNFGLDMLSSLHKYTLGRARRPDRAKYDEGLRDLAGYSPDVMRRQAALARRTYPQIEQHYGAAGEHYVRVHFKAPPRGSRLKVNLLAFDQFLAQFHRLLVRKQPVRDGTFRQLSDPAQQLLFMETLRECFAQDDLDVDTVQVVRPQVPAEPELLTPLPLMDVVGAQDSLSQGGAGVLAAPSSAAPSMSVHVPSASGAPSVTLGADELATLMAKAMAQAFQTMGMNPTTPAAPPPVSAPVPEPEVVPQSPAEPEVVPQHPPMLHQPSTVSVGSVAERMMTSVASSGAAEVSSAGPAPITVAGFLKSAMVPQ